MVKILSCKFLRLAPISPRWGSLRTEAPGGPRLAKWPCEYTVTAGRPLPGAGWTGVIGVLTMGAGDPAWVSEQEAGDRKQKAWEAGGGRQGQAGWPAFTCVWYGDYLMPGPGEEEDSRISWAEVWMQQKQGLA